MSLPLLATKFYISPPREHGIARPRLIEKLLNGLNQPGSLILLSGPAGFGKTTLLSQVAARLPGQLAWLSLDENDNDPFRFWTYLISACQAAAAGVGETALALLGSPQPFPIDAIPTILLNDLAALQQPFTLALDDYHAIQAPGIHQGVAFLLEHLPEGSHVVVSTRIDPPWPLARYRARNRLVEIRAQDLRFSIEEATAFLNQTMGLDLAVRDVAALEARTEGWVAGLQLAALSMQGRSDSAAFIKAFTGSNLYVAEYLLEEVLQRQPEEIQSFLLKTSILKRMCAGLCESVTGSAGGQEILTSLLKANSFVISLDQQGEWYRYHQLFADLLQARLKHTFAASEIQTLHRRAADWYEQNGQPAEAIEHSQEARDFPRVIAIIEKIGLVMILQAYITTVEGWLRAVPPELIEKRPRILMVYAWMNLLRGTFDQAAPFIEKLRLIFADPGPDQSSPSLEAEWLAIQSKLMALQGNSAECRDLANRALELLPEADAPVRSMVLTNLAMAYQQMMDYDHAIETFDEIARRANLAGDRVSELIGISGKAQLLLMQGRLKLTFETSSEGIRRLTNETKRIPFSATLYGELGQVYYHWRQFDLSREYSQLSMQISGKSGYSDPEIFNHITLSRMAQVEGDWENAAAEMEKAGVLARLIPPAMIREEIVSQQVRVYLAQGRLLDAEQLLAADGFDFSARLGFPPPGNDSVIRHELALLYNSCLRILLVRSSRDYDQESLRQAIALADQVLAGELRGRQLPSALETLLLRSQLHSALGEEELSLADVARALELAEPEGFISIFVEEGPPIFERITRLTDRGLAKKNVLEYVQKILAAFPQGNINAYSHSASPRKQLSGNETLIEPLTTRELEVLRLIAGGSSNQAIAQELVITVSAVKKHTANIYGKLGVNSRTHAVARARQLKMLTLEE